MQFTVSVAMRLVARVVSSAAVSLDTLGMAWTLVRTLMSALWVWIHVMIPPLTALTLREVLCASAKMDLLATEWAHAFMVSVTLQGAQESIEMMCRYNMSV